MSNYITIPVALWEKTRKEAAGGNAKPSFEVIALKAEVNALRAELAKLKGEPAPKPIK